MSNIQTEKYEEAKLEAEEEDFEERYERARKQAQFESGDFIQL